MLIQYCIPILKYAVPVYEENQQIKYLCKDKLFMLRNICISHKTLTFVYIYILNTNSYMLIIIMFSQYVQLNMSMLPVRYTCTVKHWLTEKNSVHFFLNKC